MRRYFSSLVAVVVLAISVVVAPQTAAAQSNQSGLSTQTTNKATAATGTSRRGGVTISPAFQQINVNADQQTAGFDFKVTNNSSESYEFALSVVDFGSLDETGGVLFVGNGQKTLSYRYALSPWVTLEQDRIVVDAHSTAKVPISINNKESLAPGGHYGAILVTPTDPNDANKKVQIDQVASSLLFVKKLGGEVYNLKLKSFSVRTHIFGLPKTLDLRLQNSGNVHVIPHGLATITSPNGKVVARGIVNPDSGIVLPETYRQTTVRFDTIGRSWLPGRYKLAVTYRYDDQTTSRRVETSFLYFNAWFGIVTLLLLTGVVILIVSPRVRRRLLLAVKIKLVELRNRLLTKRSK